MDAVEEIKSRLSVEEVVGDYIELKRSGRNFKGLSPFSAEKTPSFMVSPEKQIWHDFSSGRGGNIFSFVMEMDGVDFKTALETLARKAGVDLSEFSEKRGTYQKTKDEMIKATELAAKYYQHSLLGNKQALDYAVKVRGLNKQTIVDFKIGYSPSEGHALAHFLTKRSVDSSIAKKAGLIINTYKGPRDMFRGRLMVALADISGNIIGFTARQIQDEPNSPKYINTPATAIYDKSRHIFGLNLAKEAIRQTGFVVIVEGNLDVITSHQYGIKNVVATAGTALTKDQIKILLRFTPDIRLCFDQDKAGINAAERSIAVAQGAGVQISIITIEGAKDPDELIKKDLESWQVSIEKPQYSIDWLIDRYMNQFDINTANGKKRFTDSLLQTINKLEDPIEKEHYYKKLSQITEVSLDAVKQKSTEQRFGAEQKKAPKKSDFSSTDIDKFAYEDQLLSLLVSNPTTRRLMETEKGGLVFHTPERQRVYEYLETNPQVSLTPEIPEDLKDVEDYVKILVFTAENPVDSIKRDSNDRLRELKDLVKKLKIDNKKEKINKLTKRQKELQENGEIDAALLLTEQIRDILKEG
jgi:DNA primase